MKVGHKTYLGIVFAILLLFFSLWKTHIGIHSDEVHSIALGDMIARGSVLFKECWFYLQMSAVFTAPIIWAYSKIIGSTEGILLFFRIISVIVQVSICFYFYRTFCVKYKKIYVAAACVVLFTFIPDFQSFNYKQELIWFTMLEIIFLYRHYLYGKIKYIIGLGVALSASVLAYPTAVLGLPVYLWIMYQMNKTKEIERHNTKKEMFMLVLTCFVCALAFLIYVMSKISLEEFIVFLPKVFADNNLNSSFLVKLIHPFIKFVLLGIGCAPIYLYEKKSLSWIKGRKLPVVSALLMIAFIGQCYIQRAGITWHCVTYPYSLTIFILPLLYWSDSENRQYNKELICVFEYPAVLTVLCMALASNQGNITSMYGTVFSTIGCILLLGKQTQQETDVLFWERKGVLTILLFCALSMYIIPIWEQEAINPEKNGHRTIFTRRAEVTYGPAKGIRMGEESYGQYSRICAIVEKHVSANDRLFIVANYDVASYGYLDNPGDYATFSPQGGWGLADSDMAIEYFKENSSRQPSIVIIDMDYVEKNLSEYMRNTPIGIYLGERNYTLLAEENGYAIFRI